MATSNETVGDGRKTVTAAGTAVTLATATTVTAGQNPGPTANSVRDLRVTALSTNTGVIVVGGSTVVAAAGTRRGTPLSAGDTVSINLADLSKLYIDATVNGEGVSFSYSAGN